MRKLAKKVETHKGSNRNRCDFCGGLIKVGAGGVLYQIAKERLHSKIYECAQRVLPEVW